MEDTEVSTSESAPEVTTSEGSTDTSSSTSTETSSESSNDTSEAVSEVPAYKPDYKLKVYDEEKELDDPFLKALIKDADSEKKVKEIAQKYLGFDTVKGRNEKLKTDFTQYQETTKPVIDYYNQASNLLQKGNLEGFFELTKIPDQAIFEYAVKKAEQAQLPPEQRQQIEFQKQMQKQNEYLQSQNQTFQTQAQKQQSDFRAQELTWVMGRTDVQGVASSFDQRVGRQGAFRQAVIDKGLAHYAATGQDLSAEQATQEVLKLVGPLATPGNLSPTLGGQQPSLIPQNGAPPIIPNVTGRGTSPVKKQVRSLDDLKKRRAELGAS